MRAYTNSFKYETPGLEFFKADLHCHTFRDPHWQGRGCSEKYTAADYARDLVAICRAKCLDVVGLTDHNFGREATPDALEAILKEAEKHAKDGYRLTVFPGFEATTQTGKTGLQLLCLFPPGASATTVSGYVTTCLGLEEGHRFRDGQVLPARDEHHAIGVIERVGERGGITVVTAEAYKALQEELDKSNLQALWLHESMLAVQIGAKVCELKSARLKQLLENTHFPKPVPVAALWASDCKCLEAPSDPGIRAIGDRFSWIKMDQPSIEGLRQAFLDSDSRIRLQPEAPAYGHPRVTGIAVKSARFLNDLDIEFSPQLNALIGGRGSGKSTLIEYLRFALGRLGPREEDGKRECSDVEVWRAAKRIVTGEDAQHPGTFSGDTIVEVGFERDGRQYVIQRHQTAAHVFEIVDGLRTERADIANPRLFFPAVVLSQHQIHAMAASQAAVQAFIDESVRGELDRLNDREAEVRRLLAEVSSSLSESASVAATIRDTETRLAAVQSQIKLLRSKKWTTVTKEYLQFEAEAQYLDGVEAAVQEVIEACTLPAAEWPAALEKTSPSKDQMDPWTERVRAALAEAKKGVASSRRVLEAALAEFQERREQDWEVRHTAAVEAYEKTRKDLGLEEEQDGSLLADLTTQETNLRTRLGKLQKGNERISAGQETRKKLLKELTELWVKQATLRKEKASSLSTDGVARDFVILDVLWKPVEQFDAEKFTEVIGATEEALAGLAGASYMSQDDYKKIARKVVELTSGADYGPRLFAQAVRAAGEELATKGAVGRKAELIQTFGLSDAKAKRIASEVSEDALRRIEEWRMPEAYIVRVRQTPGDRVGSSLANVSAGQRATAFLALVLAEGDAPIIVDQPEDDLDNDFIYRHVVSILRKVKWHRQLIVATHNANIPVNGDAELVVALAVENGRGQLRKEKGAVALGAIDREPVMNAITAVMEGGREAFHRRRVKYHF